MLKEKSGEVLIKSSMSDAEVSELISKALISNYDELDDTTKASLQWEYYAIAYGKNTGAAGDKIWGAINGGTSYNVGPFTFVQKALKDVGEGNYQVRLAGTTTEATLVKVDKYSSKIVLKENASITYNMDAANMKEQIFNSAIDWENSVLPADAAIGDFTFEYKTLPSVADNIPLDKDKLEGLRQFAPVEGGKRDTWLDPLDYPMMGAGDQTIRVKFNGNGDYKASNVEDALKVEKANVTVTINDPIKVIYAGEKIDAKKYVSTDPADPALEIYIVYVGVNTNKESTIYLQVSGDKQNFIDGISDFQKEYLKYAEEDTLRGKLNDGITVGEFKEMLNGILSYVDNDFTKFLVNIALNKYGLTYDNLKDLLGALDKVSGIANNLRLAIGSPAHAGQYFAVAIAVNDNYNTGVSLPGSVTVLKNWKGVKLEKNPLFDAANNTITAKNNTITVSQAEKIAKSVCILTTDDEELDNSQTSVHYWFTGVNKIYAKNVMPTAPGRYIVTATVRGGDFFAFPKTFSFKIVADPTPETTPEA
ncbi:MAG: hypothetical protein MR653_08545 [Clostridiales bacterium]|nr:hypothetical protein [Clostridiales bacterium]